jgi:hypothetical protein
VVDVDVFDVCHVLPPSKLYSSVNPVTANGPFVIIKADSHVFVAVGAGGVDGYINAFPVELVQLAVFAAVPPHDALLTQCIFIL